MFHILDTFSPSMLLGSAKVMFKELNEKEAKIIFTSYKNGFWTSAIGHESTAKIASQILECPIPVNRVQVILVPGDRGLIITLSFRPEEGRVYDYQELTELLQERKISLYYFEVEDRKYGSSEKQKES